MADATHLEKHQRIIDEIRTIMYSEIDPDLDKLTALGKEYLKAIDEVNENLRTCDNLLQRGLRAESLQRCLSTSLLDSVSILDFPEREQWSEFVFQGGLPTPPDLYIDRAADLSEAFATQQPLEPLMRLHRLHALARSPLRTRVSIIRKLHQRDPENPVWETSLQTFEKARHEQLTEELASAIQHKDVKSIATLEKELKKNDWLISPPKSLIKQAVKAHTILRREKAQAELKILQERLNTSYADFDLSKGRKLRARWNAAAAIAELDDRDQLMGLVTPALNWLSQEDDAEDEKVRYEKTLSALRHALDEWESYETLKTCANTLDRFKLGIPESEQVRLAERFAFLEVAAKRRQRWKIVLAVSVVLFIASLTAVGIVRYSRSKEIADYVASLEEFLKAEDLEHAQNIVNSIKDDSPRVFENPKIQNLVNRLDSALQKDETRRQQFTQLLEQARSAVANQPTWDSIPQARKIVKDAITISKTGSEANEIVRISGLINSKERDLQVKADEHFQNDLDDLSERIRNLKNGELDNALQIKPLLQQLLQREHISPELVTQSKPLLQRLDGRIQTEQKNRYIASLLVSITDAVGSRQRFQLRLEEFIKKSPGDPRSLGFERIIKNESDYWKGIEDWNQLNETWSRINLVTISPREAKKLIADATKVIQAHKGFPGETKLQELLEYVKAIARREDENGDRLDSRLKTVLTNTTIADLYVLETMELPGKPAKRFYLDRKPIPNKKRDYWSIQYFTGLDIIEKKPTTIKDRELANPRIGAGYDWTAPQSSFSKKALRLHARLTDRNWESSFLEILTILHDETRMDPVFKYQLLENILPIAMQGSYSLKNAFASQAKSIEVADLDTNVNFLDPDNPDGQDLREQAARVFKGMQHPQNAKSGVNTQLKLLDRPKVADIYDWVGWLCRDITREWTCSISAGRRSLGQKSGFLFIVYADAKSKLPRFENIGEIKDGKIALLNRPNSPYIEGRPVYLVVKK